MSEVHRYKVVKMLSEVGNRINYDPHGPEVVMTSAYDESLSQLAALREELDGVWRLLESVRQDWFDMKSQRDSYEQRLADAERRNSTISAALELVTDGGFDPDSGSGSWGAVRITLEDWYMIKAALNKPEEAKS